eukprot:4999826-Amphidinium_carterae.1
MGAIGSCPPFYFRMRADLAATEVARRRHTAALNGCGKMRRLSSACTFNLCSDGLTALVMGKAFKRGLITTSFACQGVTSLDLHRFTDSLTKGKPMTPAVA